MQTIVTALATIGTAATLSSTPVPGQPGVTLERLQTGTGTVYFQCIKTNDIKTCEEV